MGTTTSCGADGCCCHYSARLARRAAQVTRTAHPDAVTGPHKYGPISLSRARAQLKLLVEYYDAVMHALTGRVSLYNLTADAAEQRDLATLLPEHVPRLGARLL